MCMVSAVYDYGRTHKPWPDYVRFIPEQPIVVPGKTEINLEAEKEWIKKFLELVGKAKDFDKTTGQPDCEDPSKAVFEDEVRRRLDAIEKTLSTLFHKNQ